MKIGILKTGDLPPDIAASWGEYPEIFTRFLQAADPRITTIAIDVDGGQDLGHPDAADGWLVTGSRHGVYEEHPWIDPLKSFLRDSLARTIPVVGICFGHQILAEAMGGRVVKSDKGWGLGVHDYQPGDVPDWAGELGQPWSGIAIHQDQVVTVPPEARVLMQSEFCPYAALSYGPVDAPVALSVQPHPEYTGTMVREIVEARLHKVVPQGVMQSAIESLDRPVDATPWAQTIVRFLADAVGRRNVAGAA